MKFHGWPPLVLVLLLIFLPAKGLTETAESALLSTALITSDGLALQQTRMQAVEHKAHSQRFSSLADAILFYEGLQHSGLWLPLAKGPLLRRGDFHPQIPQLRNQLSLQGDLSANPFGPLLLQHFDAELEAALKRFQQRHSLKVDGILGPQSRGVLNVPPWQRIDQLVLNIHRQQQLQQQLMSDPVEPYLHVNLPEYRLRLYQQGQVVLEMKTIIGRPKRETPVFSATVNQLVVNPDWNVPKSIAYKDILPRWQEDSEYLQKHNLQVLAGWHVPRVMVPEEEVDLSRLYQGENYLRFWEPPGENNTLGRVKFQLSSDNSIYLHDTHGRHLFEAEQRAFSSGCIRLEKPRSLADALIQLSNQWQPQLLDPLFDNAESVPIRLHKPVSVHVTYWTAWLDGEGRLNFADDLYQRDAVDFAQLQQQLQQVSQSEAHQVGMRTE